MEPKVSNVVKDSYEKSSFKGVVQKSRNAYKTGRTRDVNFRIRQLKNLLRLYEENNNEILNALKMDMRKSKLEGYLYEVDLMKNDVRSAIRNLREWSQETIIPRNWLTLADVGYYVPDPYGVVLVMGTWNYPFQLTLVPVCGAIAAGNCVIVKPSEISAYSAALMAKLIPKYLDNDCYQVVLGGPDQCEVLLRERFDYIFYTGSLNIGRKIHAAANKYLTPVTLELGGKSPVYVDETANLEMTAKRIMWGKCMNMGQTCVAPDYVLCSKKVEGYLIKYIKKIMAEWYGDVWKNAKDLARIVNSRRFEKLKFLLENSGRVAIGGGMDASDLWIQPTVLIDVKETDPIMQEEIFGPILPFITINSAYDAINFINSREKALCLYVFSDRKETLQKFQNETHSGTMAFNDTIVQFVVDELPFGGVGLSGMGNYHGKFSFDTFSHKKSIVKRDFSYLGDRVGMFRYPPYTSLKINSLSFLLCHWKKFKITYLDYFPHLFCFLLGVIFSYFYLNRDI